VIRDYIRRRCGEAELKKRNQLLLDSAKLLPHGGGAAQLSDWWYLPPATVDTLLAYLAADPAPSVRASAKSFLATYSAPLLTPVWPLPDMSSPGVRRVIDDHRTWLRSCAAAPDGRWIATAGDDHMVRLFALDTGEAGPVLSGHLAPVRGCAFFPGGRRMASASDDSTVRIWDRSSGAPLCVLDGHSGRVRGCAVAPDPPDGSTLASAGEDHVLRVWDAGNWENLASLRVDAALRDCAWVLGMATPSVCAVGVGGSYLFGLTQDASLRTSQ